MTWQLIGLVLSGIPLAFVAWAVGHFIGKMFVRPQAATYAPSSNGVARSETRVRS